MFKKIKYLKKFFIICVFTMFITTSVAVVAATSYKLVAVTGSVSKSGLKKSAEAQSKACAAVGCVIHQKNGSVLASGENGYYSLNKFHSKSVSYTGLKSAHNARVYAIHTSGQTASKTYYY